MHAVIFEVRPKDGRLDDYFGHARLLRPELEGIDGFIENIRYRSLTRPGWLLSVSLWRDEAALIAWRRHALHHRAQEEARRALFADYRLRVGVVAEADSAGVSLLTARREGAAGMTAEALARDLGLDPAVPGLVGWDVFEAVLTPGDVLLLRSGTGAWAGEGASHRLVRVIRDYGMTDRREAPQHFPDEAGRA
ncbi:MULTISPECIES: antibiotic biosynthesis monooxygenase [unclassified Acidiphilium]|uniref:antibiotic biosynthesis monooxygenase family protein n=1 Tax=unclassified Acidiphilium TaxID=2617493 RepID=UPI000214455E|nr:MULTISPECIES: antibiotic biosynthesis monooxygenase [unclassified Acidiphilium]EGO95104.1 Antibiotic biosynthesis monooxygenase [Acidiphilium sp. PM]